MSAVELNLDGLVGPTHHYGGLGPGNLASARHSGDVSNPRAAALEGLAKMRLLMDLGIRQAVLPPHERPDVAALRCMGFGGSEVEALERARHEAPELLSAASSASAMWAANAATVSPASDTSDGRVHFTPASFPMELHRALEPPTTAAVLRKIFPDPERFAHHEPLPACTWLSDEGAANHMRFSSGHGASGVEVFVYGRTARETGGNRFAARQTLEASRTVARMHGVKRALFIRQSPAAIDAGAFHNDVVSASNETVLFCHETAFADGREAVARIRDGVGEQLSTIVISERELSLAAAVESYLFNSQLVTLPGGGMALVCPEECRTIPAAWAVIEKLAATIPLRAVQTVDVRQSMRNGGGPACLRLRVVLSQEDFAAIHHGVVLDPALLARLEAWVARHYRDRLQPGDLADPHLLRESRAALDELTSILDLSPLYAFQR